MVDVGNDGIQGITICPRITKRYDYTCIILRNMITGIGTQRTKDDNNEEDEEEGEEEEEEEEGEEEQ